MNHDRNRMRVLYGTLAFACLCASILVIMHSPWFVALLASPLLLVSMGACIAGLFLLD